MPCKNDAAMVLSPLLPCGDVVRACGLDIFLPYGRKEAGTTSSNSQACLVRRKHPKTRHARHAAVPPRRRYIYPAACVECVGVGVDELVN